MDTPSSDNTPVPDPTVLTTEALARGLASERALTDALLDVIRQRLDGMDEAAHVLNAIVTRVPTEVQKEVSHLRDILEEMLRSVQVQFKERDERSARESRDNKIAVDAAFAAQKEAAAKAEDSNQKAIDKAETTSKETIGQMGGKVDDLKERVGRLESIRVGAAEYKPALAAADASLRAVVDELAAKVNRLA